MTLVEALTGLFRFFGAFYVVFGILAARRLWFWARITPEMRTLGRAIEQLSTDLGDRNEPAEHLAREDTVGPWWLFAGVLIVIAAGVAMTFTHWLALPLLAAAIVQQMAYFIRQRRRELTAPTPAAAADERLDPNGLHSFYLLLVMAVLAGWLYHEGALT